MLVLTPPPLLPEQATERDKFMSPMQAKEFGLIDHVLTKGESLDNGSKN